LNLEFVFARNKAQSTKTKNQIGNRQLAMKLELNNFIEDLKLTHGENLVSVILYGSAATGEFIARSSDYNILIALNHITPEDLRLARAPMREWRRLGHPVPVYFTVSELQNAADVFPIEFHQMQKARVVLYGQDVLANLNISDDYLRHQTEYELRSKLIRLRRLYIPVSVSVERLSDLMMSSLTSFATLFRAVLLLQGINAPATKHECTRLIIEKLNLNAAPFEKIFEMREKDLKPKSEKEANDIFTDYIVEVEKVIDFVDKMKKSASSELRLQA
jgi:hypothetical protein